MELRKLWADWIIFKGSYFFNQALSPIDVTGKISLPVITSGITNAIYITTKPSCNSGEKIIMPNKTWENYDNMFALQEGLTN